MTRWIGLACALIVLTGAATFVYQVLPEPVPEPTIELHRPSEGPPPKLEVIGEKFHEFGSMAVNTKGSHTWQFKNVGVGPLNVWLDSTSCSCTVAQLKNKEGEPKKTVTIAPGESLPMEIDLGGQEVGPPVRPVGHAGHQRPGQCHGDPGGHRNDRRPGGGSTFRIRSRSRSSPPRSPLDQTVAIVSPDRPDLKLTKLVSSKPGLIVAEAKPMAPAELERRKVKAGYDVTVEIKPGMSQGRFSEELVIESDHPNRPSLKLTITGRTYGPISVIPNGLVMPSVASRKGGSQDLSLIVRGADRDAFRGGLQVREDPGGHRAG